MKKLVLSIFILSLGVSLWAQEMTMELKDSSNLKHCQFDSQYDYENSLSSFPPKKKNNWAIGIGVGTPIILGDVRPLVMGSYAADFKVRKAFSHVFSMRFQSIFAEVKGIHYTTNVVNGEATQLNHKSRMTDNTLQAVFTLNNINFHKKQARVGLNAFVGGGFTTNYTAYNLTDENGAAYDYSNLSTIETFGDRRFVVNEVLNLLDDGYETSHTIKNGDASIKNTRILPSLVMGIGADFYLSKRVDLCLESRISKHFSDDLDGYDLGSGADWFTYSSVGFNFKIGKREEPLYWQNPLSNSYERIMALEQEDDNASMFQDLDQDGVIDLIDRDLNTPFGAEVDTKGVPLDSDKDGYPNYMDREIYSPKNAVVDKYGVANDTDDDGVADAIDREPNSAPNANVDANGKTIKGGTSSGGNILNMKGVDVWTIFFDTDAYNVKADYHPIILNLASYMIEDPSAKLILTGYTDSRSSAEYNLQLSKKRANSVLAYFTELGIGSDRFEIQFKGEEDLLIDENSVLGQQLNRRVTLKVK